MKVKTSVKSGKRRIPMPCPLTPMPLPLKGEPCPWPV